MKSFGLGFGAFDSCDSDCVHPRRSKFFPNLVVMASADHCGAYRLLREPLDLRVSGGTSSGFPSMYCSPKLRVAQRGRVVWPSLTIVDLCGTSAGPLWDLCGTSVGFPMMYSSSQAACGTSGRAVAAWLLLEPLLDLCGLHPRTSVGPRIVICLTSFLLVSGRFSSRIQSLFDGIFSFTPVAAAMLGFLLHGRSSPTSLVSRGLPLQGFVLPAFVDLQASSGCDFRLWASSATSRASF